MSQPFRKDVREMVSYAKKRGFDCEGLTGSGHWRLRHTTSGRIVILPATPGGWRFRQNFTTLINRIHKEHAS
jgi:predicted RNA binding protein YcfA (HicA-like mRNA interferase family)